MSDCPSGVGVVNSISSMLSLGWCLGLSEVDDPTHGSLSGLSSLTTLDEEVVADGLGKWWTMKDEFGEGEKEGEGEEFCWGEELLQAASCLGSSLGLTSCMKDGDFGNWRNFCNCSCKICWNEISCQIASNELKTLHVLHTLYPKGLPISPMYPLHKISKLATHSERTLVKSFTEDSRFLKYKWCLYWSSKGVATHSLETNPKEETCLQCSIWDLVSKLITMPWRFWHPPFLGWLDKSKGPKRHQNLIKNSTSGNGT